MLQRNSSELLTYVRTRRTVLIQSGLKMTDWNLLLLTAACEPMTEEILLKMVEM